MNWFKQLTKWVRVRKSHSNILTVSTPEHFGVLSHHLISTLPALMCLVKPDGPPQLCKTDEIGEIIVNSRAGGNMYYGLPGVTKNTFEVRKRN